MEAACSNCSMHDSEARTAGVSLLTLSNVEQESLWEHRVRGNRVQSTALHHLPLSTLTQGQKGHRVCDYSVILLHPSYCRNPEINTISG